MTSATRENRIVMPRLLRRERAAAYLDVSPGTFDRLVREGKLPPPKRLDDQIKGWDTRDLDVRVDHLPYDGENGRPAPSDWD